MNVKVNAENSLLNNPAKAENRKLRIALDWDGTVTEDLMLWVYFVAAAQDNGHDVRIVTARFEGQYTEDMVRFNEELDTLGADQIPVIYTNHTPKWQHCVRISWEPDIIIDDSPGIWQKPYLDWSKEQLEEWEREKDLPNRVVEEPDDSEHRFRSARITPKVGDL